MLKSRIGEFLALAITSNKYTQHNQITPKQDWLLIKGGPPAYCRDFGLDLMTLIYEVDLHFL